jgi:virginiamycin B lyase
MRSGGAFAPDTARGVDSRDGEAHQSQVGRRVRSRENFALRALLVRDGATFTSLGFSLSVQGISIRIATPTSLPVVCGGESPEYSSHSGSPRRDTSLHGRPFTETTCSGPFDYRSFPGAVSRLFCLSLVIGLVAILALLPGSAAATSRIKLSPLRSGFSNPSAIAAEPNNDLWFIARPSGVASSPLIGRLSLRGPSAEFSLSALGPSAIVAKPDGTIWFNDEYQPAIWRMSKSGSVTRYALPDTHGWVEDLTIGPGGSIWFTEFGGFQEGDEIARPRVGRISQDGQIVEYQLAGGGFIGGITTGREGDMWFIRDGSYIGGDPESVNRITPEGRITSHSFRATGSVFDIAMGADGNLWFPETGGIGRMSPEGHLKRFSVPALSRGRHLSRPTIVAGPRRSLWFTGLGPGLIGRITTRGHIEKFDVPIPGPPLNESVEEHRGLVAGLTPTPDGGLGFTEIGHQAVCDRTECPSQETSGYVGRIPASRLTDRYQAQNLE